MNNALNNTLKQKILSAVLAEAIQSARDSRAEFVLYGTLFRWKIMGDGIRLLMCARRVEEYAGVRDDCGEILADWEEVAYGR